MVTYSSFVVIALYVLITILISYLVNKRYSNGGDFSTGGKQFGWFTAGVSILATYISAMTFVGMPGWVYSSGMEAMSIHLNYPIVIFFTVIFFVPVFYKLGLTSIYEYLEHRFGVYARTINSIVFIVVQCISAGVILYAVALILVQVLPISISEAIIYISIFTACYTYAGGISTVIWTDMLQSAVLVAGSIAIFAILMTEINAADYLSRDHLNIINLDFDLGVDTTLWAGVVAVSFLHLSVYGTNQLIIQRTLATRCEKTAQKSMLLCGYGAFFVYLFFAVLGVLLSVFYQDQSFENSNEVILDFVFNHTNPIVVGLIISALAAAAMSTLDSTYNSMATVATFDIYKRFVRKSADDEHYEKVARKMSLLAAAMVVVPALLAVSNESVLKTIASLTSIFVGIRLGSFVLGLFWVKANEKGVIVGSIMSVIAVFTAMYLDVAWPWFAPIGTFVFLLFGVLVSRRWGAVTAEQQIFINNQKHLFAKPTASHYGLLVFAVATIAACMVLPDWLYAALS
ncbi:sodium:solute symporter [Vibrio alginolyticus]|uniref:sodium:solute symporter n=1 Tax=Vibrio TaxID=662 RepID=UPI0014839098|nr:MULTISPECIES: sodium:solute symporter [Vibrio]EIC9816004.1 sodium:solute symporter [Vibrio alginolyticus]EMC8462633.1 sodium:solute symporter [Vibrio alginolyticus]EME3936612.1 sodium:solute symporter [Vibrio alginolyticus]MBS9895725.1 sodium:solute symporter [Vibrio alginolyticus]MBS9946205.1 sodium:solute symporter [Vibrio alginolyticus]